MFEEVKSRLQGIDSVLNKEVATGGAGNGLTNIEHLIQESKNINLPNYPTFVLIEVELQDKDKKYSQLYLRGFERLEPIGVYLVQDFLKELKPILVEHSEAVKKYGLPHWPWYGTRPRESFKFEMSASEDKSLKISVVGSGLCSFKNNQIYVYDGEIDIGFYAGFGPIKEGYQSEFKGLLQKLLEKPAYQGFILGDLRFSN